MMPCSRYGQLWLRMHIRDFVNLIFTVPDVATKFRTGKWMVYKSQKALS